MSKPVDLGAQAFQARFSSPPDGTASEAARWRQLCQELLEERQRLREELEMLRAVTVALEREKYGDLDLAQVLAERVREPSMEEFLAELERDGAH